MTVHITDYTPNGKPLTECLYTELLETVRAIHGHGMLRMHAHDRMMIQVEGEIERRGCGLYEYRDDATEWEKSVGLRWAIIHGRREQSSETDCHEAIYCDDDGVEEVFAIGGPLEDAAKTRVTEAMRVKVAEAKARHQAWLAEEAKKPKDPNAPFIITGACGPGIPGPLFYS